MKESNLKVLPIPFVNSVASELQFVTLLNLHVVMHFDSALSNGNNSLKLK